MKCKVLLLTFFIIIISFNLSEAQMVPGIYVFGDSLVDVGNNNYLKLSLAKADLPHYGIDFPNHKASGRFTNGMNAADFLAEKVGLPTSPPYFSLVDDSNNNNNVSFLKGVSFASGGARILDGTDPYVFQSIHLTQQIGYFSTVYEDLYKQLGSSGVKNHLSKSIFAIVIGSNDILGYFRSSDLQNKTTPDQYVDSMVLSLKDKLKRLYNFGARKFVIVGIGTIGCCPARRRETENEECHGEINFWSVKYNKGLISMLQELKFDLKDIHYSFFDTYKVLLDFIQRPATYGKTDHLLFIQSASLPKIPKPNPCLILYSSHSSRAIYTLSHLFSNLCFVLQRNRERERDRRWQMEAGMRLEIEESMEFQNQLHKRLKHDPSLLATMESVTEAAMESVTEAAMEPLTEPAMEPVTDSAMESVIEPVMDSAMEAVKDSAMESVTKPPETIWKSM